MSNTWIVTAGPKIAALVDVGRAIGGTVTVVAANVDGTQLLGVDRVIVVPAAAGVPAEALAQAVADAVAAQPGDVVLAPNRPAERVLAGAVAARLGAPLLSGVKTIGSGAAELARFGGIALEQVSSGSALVAILEGGALASGEAAPVEQAAGEVHGARVISQQTKEVEQVDLTAAKRIVGCGRGFRTEGDLELARELASVLGAEVGCSRPLAEGQEWFTNDRYVGISGQHVGPEVYVAVGISGQLQHTAGIQESKVVVAVNNDPKAPIFAQADFGLVGDLYELLPALAAALR